MVEPREQLRQRITQSIIVLFFVMAIIGTVLCTNSFASEGGTTKGTVSISGEASNVELSTDKTSLKMGTDTKVAQYALVAAAAAFGLGAIGAGIAISHVGAAAMGAVAEKPQIAGQALIFVALAEGIVVFGFITAIMILNKA